MRRPMTPLRRRRGYLLMLSQVQVTRLDGDPDDLTGRRSRRVVYTGRAKIQTYEPYESAHEVASGTVVTQRYQVHVPVTAGPFEEGDLVRITHSSDMPHLVGDEFRVAGLHEKTIQTAQRLLVDEITNQKE